MLPIADVLTDIDKGNITEVFGTGTAASISPVGAFKFKGKEHVVGNRQVGPVSQRVYDTLLGIQYGEIEDSFNWVRPIDLQEKVLTA